MSMSYECFELCEVLRSYSSALNDPTPLLWICFIIVADVIGNDDKSYWLLNPVPHTVVRTCVCNHVYYSFIYETGSYY